MKKSSKGIPMFAVATPRGDIQTETISQTLAGAIKDPYDPTFYHRTMQCYSVLNVTLTPCESVLGELWGLTVKATGDLCEGILQKSEPSAKFKYQTTLRISGKDYKLQGFKVTRGESVQIEL